MIYKWNSENILKTVDIITNHGNVLKSQNKQRTYNNGRVERLIVICLVKYVTIDSDNIHYS